MRLNTNESPEPPPAAFRDAFAAELSRVDWHRYPDRSATDLREAIADPRRDRSIRCSPPTARTRSCRPCCSPTPGPVERSRRSSRRTRCTPRSPGSPVRRSSRASVAPTSRSTRPRSSGSASNTEPHVVFLTSPNNPTGLVEPVERVAQLLELRSGLVVVDEAYAQFADWSALDLVDEDAPAGGHPHLLQDVVDGGRPARLSDRSDVVRGRTRQGRAAVPPRRGEADRWSDRAALRRRHERPGATHRQRARTASAPASPTCGFEVFPSGANFVLFRSLDAARSRTSGRVSSTATSWSATVRVGRASTTACGSPSAPRREHRVPRRARRDTVRPCVERRIDDMETT